jgi:hypothetical protein
VAAEIWGGVGSVLGIHMEGKLFLEFLEVVILGVGGWIALRTFERDSKLRRTEWIYRLYEQFYESDRFKPMRRLIDYAPAAEIAELEEDLKKGTFSVAHEALIDYLNFFEFIAVQIRRNNLSRSEVMDMFDYYIRRLKDHDFVVRYLKPRGFENLDALLLGVETGKSTK